MEVLKEPPFCSEWEQMELTLGCTGTGITSKSYRSGCPIPLAHSIFFNLYLFYFALMVGLSLFFDFFFFLHILPKFPKFDHCEVFTYLVVFARLIELVWAMLSSTSLKYSFNRQILAASAKKCSLIGNVSYPFKSEVPVLRLVYEFMKMEMVYTYEKVKQCGGFIPMLCSECSSRICP